MEVRQRIRSVPVGAIVLVLVLIAAVIVALNVGAMRLSAPARPQNGIGTAQPQVVAPGKEPDTQDAYQRSRAPGKEPDTQDSYQGRGLVPARR